MLTGKDRGKQGRVLEARPREGKVVVENLNMMKRHQKPRPIRDSSRMGGTEIAPGGIVDRPSAVPVSNVMVVCPTCKQPTRIGLSLQGGEGRRAGQGARLQARRLRPGDRPVSATAETYVPRLKARYNDEIRARLKDELELDVDHAVADGRRRSRSTWASGRARPTRSRSTPRSRS